jgi:rhodanese-related sulfurtransferase
MTTTPSPSDHFNALPANWTPESAKAAIDQGKAVLLDVREVHERRNARIPGTIHIPLAQLPSRVHELPRDRIIVCQCATGGRSATATTLLRNHGLRSSNLAGGIVRWNLEGLPIERGD